MPVFCGTELRFGSLCNLGLSKKLRFSLQRHKTREFGEAEFSDCLPVSALVCVFAFDTGGLGLWGGQGFIGAKASLDPLCRALWHRASFWHRNTHVLRKRRVPKLQKAVLFAIVCRFFVAQSSSQ